MIERLIIGIITYYLVVFVVIYKCNLKEMLHFRKKEESETSPGKEEKKSIEQEIMGKSHSQLRQQKPNDANESQYIDSVNNTHIFVPREEKNIPLVVSEDRLNEIFSEAPTPMNIPADEEETEPDLEEEEVEFEKYQTEGIQEYATGITVNEVGELYCALQKEKIPEVEKSQVQRIVRKIEGTDMFEMLIALTPGGNQNVLALMGSELSKEKTSSHKDEKKTKGKKRNELDDFDINDYL